MSLPYWWPKVGDLVAVDDSSSEVGVVLEVAEPGVARVRWGTDDRSHWHSTNDLHTVKVRR